MMYLVYLFDEAGLERYVHIQLKGAPTTVSFESYVSITQAVELTANVSVLSPYSSTQYVRGSLSWRANVNCVLGSCCLLGSFGVFVAGYPEISPITTSTADVAHFITKNKINAGTVCTWYSVFAQPRVLQWIVMC